MRGQSGTDGELDLADFRNDERAGRQSAITGTGFLAGATVKLGGTSATGVTVVNSTYDHGDHAGARRGRGQRGGHQHRCSERHFDQRLYLHLSQSGTDGEFDLADLRNQRAGRQSRITGTGFLAGATVKLGGTAATGVTVVNSTSITATTAAHAAGAVNVVVTNTRCPERHLDQRLHLHR